MYLYSTELQCQSKTSTSGDMSHIRVRIADISKPIDVDIQNNCGRSFP